MVDEPRVQRLLRRVVEDVATLRELGSSEDVSQRVRLGAIKYAFVTAIEGCVRVGQHLGASEGWRAPDRNADAFVVLAEHSVLDDLLAARLGRAVGFRNLLVHQYADVDDERVVAMLEEVGDLETFVTAVSAWVEAQR
ncbi:MAG: type VII toxin-antitoxin system HepT family RNase toxin [Ilumatobacteraceae bacterium]